MALSRERVRLKSPFLPLALPQSARKLRRLLERHCKEERYGEALAVAEELARVAPSREVYFRLGVLRREAGRLRDSVTALRDALRFRTGTRYLLPEIHLHTAFAWFLLGQRNRMADALRRAYSFPNRPRTGYAFHMVLGARYFLQLEFRKAHGEFVLALESAKKPRERARAACNAGLALLRGGDLTGARAHLDRAIRIQKWQRQWTELAATRAMRASLHFDLGQPKRALGILERAARTFRRFGKRNQEAECLQNAGYVAGELGLWTRSLGALDRAIDIASTQGWKEIECRARACRAVVYARQDLADPATEDLARAVQCIQGRRDPWCTLFIARARARIAGMWGNWEEMRRAAAHGERVASKIPDILRVIELRRLRAEAEEALGRVRAARYARVTTRRLEGMLGGSSEVMRRLLSRAEKLAQCDVPILIVGESAAGGGELARAIHGASRRSRRPCVVVPCERLVFPASELCGRIRGAWTSADSNEPGMVRSAQGGTLILDRLDEMSPEKQAHLIPVLERRIRSVGGAAEDWVDVRFIAVCENEKRLIPGVRARISGATLRVPPLRDRREDIPGLVKSLLRGRRRATWDAIAELVRHPWDGNLAELAAVVDRLVVISEHVIGRKQVRIVLKTKDSYREARTDAKRRHNRSSTSRAVQVTR